jgi:hypothetical protein
LFHYAVILLFSLKNLQLLNFFVLLHQLEKSELKNVEGTKKRRVSKEARMAENQPSQYG